MMDWSWSFFTDTSGRQPVRDFLDTKTVQIKAKFYAALRVHVEGKGLLKAGDPNSTKVEEFWQIRADYCRFLAVEDEAKKQHLVFIHAFEKKTKKTPQKEIAIARNKRAQLMKAEQNQQ